MGRSGASEAFKPPRPKSQGPQHHRGEGGREQVRHPDRSSVGVRRISSGVASGLYIPTLPMGPSSCSNYEGPCVRGFGSGGLRRFVLLGEVQVLEDVCVFGLGFGFWGLAAFFLLGPCSKEWSSTRRRPEGEIWGRVAMVCSPAGPKPFRPSAYKRVCVVLCVCVFFFQ